MIGNSMRFIVIFFIANLLSACAVKSSRSSGATSTSLKIQDIRVAEGVDKTIVEIEGEGLMLFTSFQLSDPDRLILEISEVDLGKYRNEIKLAEGPVHAIIPIPMNNIFVSRLEFELADHVKTDVRPEGLNIVVEVTQLDDGMGAMGMAQKNKGMHAEEGVKGGSPRGETAMAMKDAGQEGKGKADLSLPNVGGAAGGALPPPLVPPATLGGAGEKMPSTNEGKPGSGSELVAPKAPKMAMKESPLPATSAAPLSPAKMVKAVRVIKGDNPQVLVALDGMSVANVFYSDAKKRRIVIDFPGVQSSGAPSTITGDGRLVERIRIGKHPDKIRMVLDLVQAVEYSWEQSQGELKMMLKAGPK